MNKKKWSEKRKRKNGKVKTCSKFLEGIPNAELPWQWHKINRKPKKKMGFVMTILFRIIRARKS